MAPRANWKGFLRLSLVTCPVALYPATSDAEKISFNQINRKTGNRIKYAKVDADTGEEVSNEDITKGYKVDTDTYIEVSKDELENIALESNRTIEIDEFVPKSSIDPRYLIRPYYSVPDGKVGHDAFAVIRETIRNMDMVAIGRVVLTSREHIIGIQPLENGLMGTLLRYPYEVRDEKEYFDDIQDVKLTKDIRLEQLQNSKYAWSTIPRSLRSASTTGASQSSSASSSSMYPCSRSTKGISHISQAPTNAMTRSRFSSLPSGVDCVVPRRLSGTSSSKPKSRTILKKDGNRSGSAGHVPDPSM
jgi:Ku protein